MFRHMLMAGASRIAFSPETDDGHDFDDTADDQFDEFEEDPDTEDEGADDQEDGEDADDPEGEPEGGQQRQQSRGENRVAKLAREAKEAKEEKARLERELADLRQQRQTPAQPSETAQQRAERLAAMTPEARLEYMIHEQGQQTQARIAQIEFNSWDAGDRAEFKALCAANPAVAKLADKVEDALKQMRNGGQNASRETVAKYMLGEMALSRAPRAAAKGARAAAAGRERQQGRPGQSRSDAAAGSRKGDERAQRRARLENMEI